MAERITAWQCIGCGRIEAPQQCIGICRDRKVDFVDAADHDALLENLKEMRRRTEALASIVRQIAVTTPRAGQCERTWRALQQRARQALQSVGGDTAVRGGQD
jgi:hypothetical protein